MDFVKILFLMYFVTLILLLLLAFVLFKMETSEIVCKVWLIAVYIISGLLGGFLIGKRTKNKKFLWGFFMGVVYFAILFIVCFCARNFISVNYDMNDYLPEESASTVALNKMNEEYDGGIPNARVMVKDVTIPEALGYKEKLKAVDGVTDVVWLDDSKDLSKPTEFMDADTLETYYKYSTALYSVTIDEDKRIEACDAIREIIGDENAMSGSAVSTAVATTSTVTEIPIIAAFGVAFVFFVLLLTTTSWAEPVIVLIGLGVAIVINAGSNLIFGEISFVTNAAGSILQLESELCRRLGFSVRRSLCE